MPRPSKVVAVVAPSKKGSTASKAAVEVKTPKADLAESERRHRKPILSFGSYIQKVLKQVHPDTGLAGEALAALINMVKILLKRLVAGINEIMTRSGGQTISSRTVSLAVRLILPKELAKHAVSEGVKACTKYASVYGDASTAKEGNSRSFTAGLQFPVTRTENLMMKYSTSDRKSATAAVFLTATLEYLMAEVLELSGNVAKQAHRHRISPRHIMLAVHSDEELAQLFQNSVFAGGVVPDIPEALIAASAPKRSSKSSSSKSSSKPKKTPKVEGEVKESKTNEKSGSKKIASGKSGKVAKASPKKVRRGGK